jgi:cysteine-rich repeat protein
MARATAVVALMLLAVPDPARAVCGDGISDAAEECDDGNLISADGCSPSCRVERCAATAPAVCIDAARAQLQVNEKTPGKDRLKLRWSKASTATTLYDFGDVVGATSTPSTTGVVSLCLYDDTDTLIREVKIAKAGQSCGGSSCWRVNGASYVYKDDAGSEDAMHRFVFTGGRAGGGKAFALAYETGDLRFPFGLAAALSGNTHPTIQLQTSAGFCLAATINKVMRDDGVFYFARKK